MSRLLYYLRLFPYHVGKNIQAKMTYGVDFLLGILANIFRQALGLIFIWVIFQDLPTLQDWTLDQVVFIYGMQAMCLGLNEFFFAGTWLIPKYVKDGDLDRILLRPVDTFYSIMTTDVTFHGLGSVFLGLVLCIRSARALNLSLNLGLVIFWILAVISGSLIFFSANLIGATFSFWFLGSPSLMMVMQNISELSKYPLTIYPKGLRFLLTLILPFAFASFYPSQVLLGGEGPSRVLLGLAVLGVGAIFLGLARAFWSYGLSKYQSTGS